MQRTGVVLRVLRALVAVLVAFGIFGAIGTFLVAEFLPGVVERIRADPPVLFSVGFDDDFYSEGFTLVVPASEQIGEGTFDAVDGCASLRESARQAGAADYATTHLQLIAEGRTLKDVTIVGMHARVIRRSPPATGSLVSCASAGSVDVIALGFDLDEPEPVARTIDETGNLGKPWFGQDSAVTLIKGELIPFRITASTRKSYVEWELAIEMIIDGEKREITLDNEDAPFRTTAPLPRARDYQRTYEWAWYEQPPKLLVSNPSGE